MGETKEVVKVNRSRSFGLDLIKVVAMLLVILQHHLASIGFYSLIFGESSTLYILSMIQSITLTCVPLFLVSTGYLLSGREIGKRHYVKVIYFIVEVILIYLMGTLVYVYLIEGVTFREALIHFAKYILAPTYYVNLYITLFMFLPFYNKLYFSLEKNQRKMLLLLLITFISLIRLQNLVPHFVYFSGWPSASYPTLYYFIGLAIKDFQPNISKKKLICFIIAISGFYALFMRYYMSGRTFYYLLGHYEGVFTMLLTILLFLLLYNIKIENSIFRKTLVILSSMSLSFYILGSTYTDIIALKFIEISSKPLYNLPTFLYKLILSSLFILPVAYVIFAFQKKVINPLIMKIEGRVLKIKSKE